MKVLKNTIDLSVFFSHIRSGSLLMLDYDGTLAPLVKERMQAYPYPGIKERLAALMLLEKSRTVIVSGRSLSDLTALLSWQDQIDILETRKPAMALELWGSHGLERQLPDGSKILAEISPKIRKGLQKGIDTALKTVDPAHCEVKPYSIALHWRGLQPSEKEKILLTARLWEDIISACDLEIHRFDGGVELRPKERNKGNVVQELLQETPQAHAIAYLGDDATDEEAFAALGDRGLKVLVRSEFRPTLADIFLRPPDELLAILDLWITSSL